MTLEETLKFFISGLSLVSSGNDGQRLLSHNVDQDNTRNPPVPSLQDDRL